MNWINIYWRKVKRGLLDSCGTYFKDLTSLPGFNTKKTWITGRSILCCFFCGFYVCSWTNAQVTASFNGNLDMELTTGGQLSHYYYNELNRSNRDLTFDLARGDAIAQVDFNDNWQLNAHVMLERILGQRAGIFNKWDLFVFRVPQLNIKWQASEKPLDFTVGQFISPFGSFFSNQLYADRTFITVPLTYGYFTNVSARLGYVSGLQEETNVNVNDANQWGNPSMYRLGYKTGFKAHYGLPGKTNFYFAVVDGALNRIGQSGFFDQFAVVAKVSVQPNYFSKFGLSLSHGTFIESNMYTENLSSDLNSYRQTGIALDFEVGKAFWEFGGELNAFAYNVPEWGIDSLGTLVFLRDNQNLSNFGLHTYLKYEPPFWSGGFIAYQFEGLLFGGAPTGAGDWDNNVNRHTLALGYKVTEYLLLKSTFSTQSTANRDWANEMRLFRLMASFHW